MTMMSLTWSKETSKKSRKKNRLSLDVGKKNSFARIREYVKPLMRFARKWLPQGRASPLLVFVVLVVCFVLVSVTFEALRLDGRKNTPNVDGWASVAGRALSNPMRFHVMFLLLRV